jgi:hypothetical protein
MMAWPFAVTVGLSFVTLIVGLRAAWLWWESSQDAPVDWPPTQEPNLHIARIEGGLVAAAELNSRAAKWTACAAVLGAVTSVWGALSAHF